MLNEEKGAQSYHGRKAGTGQFQSFFHEKINLNIFINHETLNLHFLKSQYKHAEGERKPGLADFT